MTDPETDEQESQGVQQAPERNSSTESFSSGNVEFNDQVPEEPESQTIILKVVMKDLFKFTSNLEIYE